MSILHPIDTFCSVRRLIPVPPSPFQVNEPFLDLMASLVDGPNGVDGKPPLQESEFSIDNLLVRIHLII